MKCFLWWLRQRYDKNECILVSLTYYVRRLGEDFENEEEPIGEDNYVE